MTARPDRAVPAAVAAAVLVALTSLVALGGPLPDAVLEGWVAARRTPALVTGAAAVTWLGSAALLVPAVVLGAAAARTATGSWRPGGAVAVVGVGAWASVQLLKVVLSRPRPTGGPGTAGGFAFPSGHAADATACWVGAALVVVAWTARSRRRRPARAAAAVAAAGAVAVAVGLTRVVLGVHHPTDVVAGWALGTLWALLAPTVLAGRERHRALAA